MASHIHYGVFPLPAAARTHVRAATGRASVVAVVEQLHFRSQPALFAALALSSGIALSRVGWISPAWLLLSGLLPLAILAGALRNRSRLALLPLFTAWLLLGWCLSELQPGPEAHTSLVACADGASHSVTGHIVRYGAVRIIESLRPFSNELQKEQDLSVQLAVTSVDGHALSGGKPGGTDGTPGGMRLAIYAPASMTLASVRCGDTLTVETRLKLAQQYRDPGVWDGRAWLASQGIAVLGAADARTILLPVHESGFVFSDTACWIHGLQVKASSRLIALGSQSRPHWLPPSMTLTDADAGMLSAMVTGDRSYLERGERQGFERTGSFHVLVVSGLHVGLIAALVLAGTTRLRAGRNGTALVTAIVATGYAVFSGFGAPVQRALWMVLLYLAARALFRERHAMQAVGVAALCLLAWDPQALFDAGLQMTLLTVIATGGLVAPFIERSIGPYLAATRHINLIGIDHTLAPKTAQFRIILRLFGENIALLLPGSPAPGRMNRTLAWLARMVLRVLEMLAVSAAVELVMALPMALYFHRATVLALPVNLVLIPMMVMLLPAAILTAATALLAQNVAIVPAAFVAVLLHIAVGIIHFFARVQAGDVRMATPPPWTTACALLLLGASVWGMRQRRRIAITLVTAFAFSMCLVVMPHRVRARAGVLEVAALDVGQGDALLLVTPQGKTVMVDCGGPTGGDLAAHGNFEMGEDVVSPALWSRGIRRLDAVALTHAHSDHMGGMFAVLRNFHPRELWVGNNPPTGEYKALLLEAAELGVSVHAFHTGDGFIFGGMEVRILAPSAGYQPAATAKNDDSLVMRVAYRSTSALLEGDAEAYSEAAMTSLPSIRSDVLKVGHHGSSTSTTPGFLQAVSPRYAVISVGLNNLYHHPRFETLQHLQQAGVQTWRTDLDGISTFYLEGERIETAP